MSSLSEISPNQFILLASIISISIADGLDPDEINVLANFLAAIGQNLAIIAYQKEATESNEQNRGYILY